MLPNEVFCGDSKVDEVLAFEYRPPGSVYVAADPLDLLLPLYGRGDYPRALGSSGPR